MLAHIKQVLMIGKTRRIGGSNYFEACVNIIVREGISGEAIELGTLKKQG